MAFQFHFHSDPVLGGRWRVADPGGLVTSWKALPENGLLRVVGEERGGTMDVNPVVGVACPSLVVRLDQRNLVACDCEGEVVRGERRGGWEAEAEDEGSMGIS